MIVHETRTEVYKVRDPSLEFPLIVLDSNVIEVTVEDSIYAVCVLLNEFVLNVIDSRIEKPLRVNSGIFA